jgi:hypothetical protein
MDLLLHYLLLLAVAVAPPTLAIMLAERRRTLAALVVLVAHWASVAMMLRRLRPWQAQVPTVGLTNEGLFWWGLALLEPLALVVFITQVRGWLRWFVLSALVLAGIGLVWKRVS